MGFFLFERARLRSPAKAGARACCRSPKAPPVVPPVHWTIRRWDSSGLSRGGRESLSCLSWCDVSVFLDEPAVVVAVLEGEQSQAEILDGLEALYPQHLLLQRPHKPLGNPIALGLVDEGWAGANSQGTSARSGSIGWCIGFRDRVESSDQRLHSARSHRSICGSTGEAAPTPQTDLPQRPRGPQCAPRCSGRSRGRSLVCLLGCQSSQAALKEGFSPSGEGAGVDAQRSGQLIKRLPTKQSHDRFAIAFRREPAPFRAGFRGHLLSLVSALSPVQFNRGASQCSSSESRALTAGLGWLRWVDLADHTCTGSAPSILGGVRRGLL